MPLFIINPGLGTKRISTVIEKSKVSNNKGSNLTIAKIVYCSLSSKFHDISTENPVIPPKVKIYLDR